MHLDLWGISLIDTDPAPLKAFLWVIEHLLAERGVSADRPVVVYEETSGTRAARAFWFLELFGHPDVRVLDGGVKAWTAAGLPLSLHHVAPVPTTWLGTLRLDVAGHLEGRARSPRARRRVHPRHEVGRASTAARSSVRREGARFPGPMHLEWKQSLGPDGAFKPAAELRGDVRTGRRDA